MNYESWNRPREYNSPMQPQEPQPSEPAASPPPPEPPVSDLPSPPSAPPPARRPSGKRAGGAASFVGVAVLSAVLGAGLITGLDSFRDDGNTTVAPAASSSTGLSTSMVTGATSVADIYERVSASVVEINTVERGGSGIGSGVVLNTDGLILTNNHVVQGATSISVRFTDGQTATARVIETNPNDDLAVIDVDGITNLVPAQLGDSSALRAGDEIIAIGNPLGLENTVTLGVVSGLGRELSGGRGSATLTNLIQLDAAVNPGNSGGGLFNAEGKLVGIPTAIENPTGDTVFVGIAYAVPVSTALRDMHSLAGL